LALKPAKSTKDKAYRGLAYNDEWSQSHSAWTNNHRAFYKTLRDVYNKKIFAEKLLIHKENCDAISDVYGFMTAFRYDMQIRMNAFAHQLPSKDGAAIPDIAVKQSVVIEQCYSIVRSFGEASWKDNLYAPGNSHTNFNPDTGTRRPEMMKSASFPMGKHLGGPGNHQDRRRENKRWNPNHDIWSHQGYHSYGTPNIYNQNNPTYNHGGGAQPYFQHNHFNHAQNDLNQFSSNFNQGGYNAVSRGGLGDGRKRFRGGSSGEGGKSFAKRDAIGESSTNEP
jgi:hypothetical protein